MLDDLISAYGSRFLVAALGVCLALLCLFIVLWLLRNRAPSPFVRGGRNRQPRLQVLDAAAIDTRRRIVLIRRDNVEHLVMIGGPTDLLIETGIGDERHYLTARALQPQGAAEEPGLVSTAAASLPQTQPSQPNLVARESVIGQTAAAIDRDLSWTTRQVPVEQPATARQAEETVVPAERRTEGLSSDRRQVDRTIAEPLTSVAPKAPMSPAPAQPVAPPPASAPTAPVIASMLAAMPAAVAMTSTATAPARTADPATLSPVSPLVPAQAPVVSASFAPEVHGASTINAPLSIQQEPIAIDPTPPKGVLIDGPLPAIDAEKPVEVAESLVRAEPVIAPPVIIEPMRPQPVPSLDTPPQAPSFGVAPAVEVETLTGTDTSTGFEAPPVRQTPPPVSPQIDGPTAEDMLDSARARVLSSPTNDAVSRPFEAARFAPERPTATASERPAPEAPAERDLSDFERVLEEEMALHIAADPAPPKPQSAAAEPIPALLPETRPDRPRPPMGAMVAEPRQPAAAGAAGATQPAEEPNLQNEIARIFGEMSASRNS